MGGFDLGADAAGLRTLWQCEISDKPRSVLARHWPDATRYTDVQLVEGDKIAPVDVISFGSPCQDLSVAGKRAGLDGGRSGLFHQAIRIAKEMQDATAGEYPRFLVWENVRGAFSSNGGDDFRTVVEEMANLGAMDVSWRLVNACHFGVPQRRLRVFVVADLRGERAGEVLAQPTRLLWHPDQGNTPGQEATGETTEGAGVINEYVYTKGKRAQSVADNETWETGRPSPTLNLMDNSSETFATVLAVTEIAQAYDGYNMVLSDTTHHTLRTGRDSSDCIVLAEPGDKVKYQVRRLTPLECERLMGWPDDHTRYDKDGNELSDSARYKMCGNGIAAPVAQWLCENLVKAMAPTDRLSS